MMRAYRAYLALSGRDEGFVGYVEYTTARAESGEKKSVVVSDDTTLRGAIIKGLASDAAEKTREMLKSSAPLDIVKAEIIPALDTVGVGFEKKTIYLPALLMSAEAAGAAFEVIKSAMPSERSADRARIVLATVKGDIHDIGKNIVKLILENYGFAVSDLGRDVAPELVVSEAKRLGAKIVGLSALMTTTVPAMEETIRLLRENLPECRIIVGGAVLTAEYAEKIGADKYAADAMDAVRYAESLEN